jgi:hypothetical protein
MPTTEEFDMPTTTHSFILAGLFASGLATLSAAAAAAPAKTYEFPAADACQLSLPTTDTRVRPRANGYRNEGTANQFVICGMGGYENSTVLSTTLLATSMDGQAHAMSCTGVTGLVGLNGGPLYSVKTVDVPASGTGMQTWAAEDFGGTEGGVIEGGLNLSVTCALPPNVALQGFESEGVVDAGN